MAARFNPQEFAVVVGEAGFSDETIEVLSAALLVQWPDYKRSNFTGYARATRDNPRAAENARRTRATLAENRARAIEA
jgi:hypothetical protein